MRHHFKSDVLRRSYRIVALGVVLGLVGIVSLIIDWRWRAARPASPNLGASVPAAPTRQMPLNPLANYPAPEAFERIAYDGHTITEQSYIEIGGKCTDTYFTVVLFPADIDYRNDPTRAVVNRATPCPPEKTFTFRLTAADLRPFPVGKYYVIVADQGTSGMWYNPR